MRKSNILPIIKSIANCLALLKVNAGLIFTLTEAFLNQANSWPCVGGSRQNCAFTMTGKAENKKPKTARLFRIESVKVEKDTWVCGNLGDPFFIYEAPPVEDFQ